MPQVSIIMPCHNGEKYIQKAIDSVISQTFRDWELLIIDDNSTDNSISIIEEYIKQDERIRLFHTVKSTGCPATPRNVGIEIAQGRFIAFLDCDDIWLPTKLEKQVALFNDNVSIVFSYYKKMDENGNINDSVIKSPNVVRYKNLLNGNCIGNLTGVYDTKKVSKVFQKEKGHEDYIMWLEILKKGYMAKNTESVEAVYRECKSSVSGNKFRVFKWTWNIYRKEFGLSFIESIYHFCIYVVKAVSKFIK